MLLQHSELLLAVNHHFQTMQGDKTQLIRTLDALKEHNGTGNAGISQLNRFLDTRDSQAIRVSQRLRDRHDTVTISIGLDHGHDFAGWSSFPDLPEIVAKGVGVNPRRDCAHL
jgi:hypothetical protein